MSATLVLLVIAAYFGLLILISYFTGKKASNQSFFVGDRNSPWYLVAFGMIGTSLSGITFISVPGWVASSQFAYMQIVLGYLIGYVVIATVLMPLYYRLQLTSIYAYLKQRFGNSAHKTGAFYFLISRMVGASLRLLVVAKVLQLAIFDDWGVPFELTVAVTILLIWVYTFKGGIKTIVWTDSLQTLFMLTAVGVAIYQIGSQLDMGMGELTQMVSESKYAKIFFFDDSGSKLYFWKQLLSGAFIAIAMTGLDQDMMQKNLSCRNLKEAQTNMFSFSIVLVFVNLFFLVLGALLYLFIEVKGLGISPTGDDLFPALATGGYLGVIVALAFILGLVAAAYSSADSALTALTTSFCIDFLNIEERPENERKRLRKRVHQLMSLALFVLILLFYYFIKKDTIIDSLFIAASYTYGPLLGLFAFGLFTKWQVKDQWIPLVAVVAPLLTFGIKYWVERNSTYKFSYELLIMNGLLTFIGLVILIKSSSNGPEPIDSELGKNQLV